MKFFQRSLVALGLAAVTPILVFAAIQIFFSLQAKRRDVELLTLARARQIQELTDARLNTELSALRVLSTSSYLAQRNWGEFYARIKRAQIANPEWAAVIVADARTGKEIFDTRQPLQTIGNSGHSTTEQRLNFKIGEPTIGSVLTASPGLAPYAYIHLAVAIDDGETYNLTIALELQTFQDILAGRVNANETAAIVDRSGNFIARTINFSQMAGKPATHFVRDAIASGEEGLYRGTTHEGFENYTAFYKSPWSGWSSHIAIAAQPLDALSLWSFIVAGLAGLGTIALGGTLILLVARDMAEMRRREETLRQSQKIEAVGRLTAGIAHDFNNLLTAIIGNLDLIRSRSAGNERVQALSANALDAARRAEKLTSRLLAFSREQRLTLKAVDLNQLLQGMHDLLLKSLGPRVVLVIDVDSDASVVMSDANQLELALINLAVNARDAMPTSGSFTIRTRRIDASEIRHGPKQDCVEIIVSDTGVGMTEDVRARALEPFFTTKPLGQGTGLGLPQVFGIVRASGGTMRLESTPGEGSTVTLLLPTIADASSGDESPSVARPLTVPLTGDEHHASILVVDDDDQVRSYIVDSLRDFRYRVLQAANGAQALELLRTATVDLMVVDFAMPGMNGAEVARAALASHSGIRILMVSGYADSTAVEAAIGPNRLLRKPFNVAELNMAIANVLHDRPVDG